MPEAMDLKNIVVEKLITSYETMVGDVSSLIDSAFFILSDFQETMANTKEERERVNHQLREALAKNEHLRKKDFDNMMKNILQAQEERERHMKQLLREYFNEQKVMAQGLRENLAKFRDSLAKGDVERVKEFQVLIKDILNKQEERKKEVTSNLKGFQRELQNLASKPKELLAFGDALRIKDFKLMLKEIKTKREERLVLQKKRKEGVVKMLAAFREKRKKSVFLPGAIPPALSTEKKLNEVRKGGVNIDERSENIPHSSKSAGSNSPLTISRASIID